MENSLNSSSPEPTVSGLKSVFKKPRNFQQAFEVSLDESVTTTKNNKSDVDLDKTTSGSNKAVPFKKTRKSIQQRFNVTLDDSLVNSEAEESVTFAKPQSVFAKKNKTLVDFFNVSYNDTNVSSQPDAFSKSIDESNIVYNKKNPFSKANETQNLMLVADESSMGDSLKENTQPALEESPKPMANSFDGDEADSTTFLTKQNPFKKFSKQRNDSVSRLSISMTDKNKSSVGNKSSQNITNNSRISSGTDSSVLKSKLNPFKEKSVQNSDSISVTNEKSEQSVDISKEDVLACSMETSKNLGLDKNISKVTNNTTYLEQSSINDDNLNNWMSDQSDEEMPPPRIPSLPANLSHTKETQVGTTETNQTNPFSVWEQKLSEIVSNAEQKSKAVKLKLNSNTPQKQKPFKKPDQNVGKPPEEVHKYKPPKLVKPAPFATKKLYEYIIKKLEPKYGIDTMLEAENLVMSICDTVKKVTRRKTHQKKLIQQLKKEMAQAGLIETTMDFYEFVIKFLPYSFRVKVVPCLQPVTNVVFPPKDVLNPFDKIL